MQTSGPLEGHREPSEAIGGHRGHWGRRGPLRGRGGPSGPLGGDWGPLRGQRPQLYFLLNGIVYAHSISLFF